MIPPIHPPVIYLSLKSQSSRQKDVSGEIVPCATAEKAKGSSWQGSRDKCQQYSKSVNVKTFDQFEQVTSIWYHGLAASKACLQVPLPFPFPTAFNFLYLLLTFFRPLRGSRSQANVKGRLLLTQSKILIQVPFLIAKKVGL